MNLYDLLLRMFGWNDSNCRERQLQSLRIKDKLGGGSDDSLDKVWVPTADDLERASRAKEESLEKRLFYERSDQRITKWLKAGAVPIQRTVDEVVHQKLLDEMREQIWPEGTVKEQEVEWNRRLLGKRYVAPREMVPDGFTEEDRKSTRLNSSHSGESRMPSSA